MPRIVISGIPIDIPASGEAPNWSQSVIQAFQAIEIALQSVIGDYDVSPQTFTIDAYNPGTNVPIPPLSFPTDKVRAVFVRYMVHRKTDANEINEQGTMWALYNTTNAEWDLSIQESGDAKISFNMTAAGQIRFTTENLAGNDHEGFVTFTAQALENL